MQLPSIHPTYVILCKILEFVIAAQGWLDGRMVYVPVFWFKYIFVDLVEPFCCPFDIAEASNQCRLELPAASISLRHREGPAVESLHGQLEDNSGPSADLGDATLATKGRWPQDKPSHG